MARFSYCIRKLLDPSKYLDENKQRRGCFFFFVCVREQDIIGCSETETGGGHNGRGDDGGSEATFLSAPCPSFAHPPNPPQPISLPASPISSDNNTGKGVEGEEEVGSGG